LKIAWWGWEDDKIKKLVPYLLSNDIEKLIEVSYKMMENK